MSTGARLIDRGYRNYDGPRGGVRAAVRSVWILTMQRTLGIRRPARAKVFPVIAIALAYIPTAVYVGITVIGNKLEQDGVPAGVMTEAFIPTYAANYGQIVMAILVLAAFVAPEVLCPDRQTGMLGLYLASPLTGGTYLLAKAAAVLSVVAIVTLGPPILLLIGYSTQGYGPDGLAEWLATFGRIVAAGLTVSVLYSVLSLAISSITPRKAAASAAFVAAVIGSAALVTYLVEEADQPETWALLNLATLPYETVFKIFDEPTELTSNGNLPLSAAAVYAAYTAWVAVGLVVIWWRYRRAEATR